MYVEFKEDQKHASVIADQSPMHEAFRDAGYCLTADDLIVDIDSLPKETIEKMIQAFDIKTQVVWTDRGCHLYFRKPKGFRGTRNVTPLGFDAEYKHIVNTKAITIKRKGILRTIDNVGVREELPDFLYSRTKLESLEGLDSGDGRNQKLYAHKFKIMSVNNWKKCLSFINSYIFAIPMEDDEFTTVCREEQIRAEKDNEYEVSVQLMNKLKIIKYSDHLYMYDGKKYLTGEEFTTTIAEHLKGQKIRYIDEVINQLEYRIKNIKEPAYGFDIKFNNGILRDGRWIEVNSSDFTPFYVDLEYNEDAEPVEAVENFLTFLTEGDADYRKLILETMAHTLITDPEFKRQLAKFFVWIGNGGNGKGTMLTILRRILGNDNCSSLSPEEMTKESYFTSMRGKLANLGDDIEEKAIDEKQMKALKNISTCDYVSSRELYKQSKQVIVTTSLIFTSNHLLKSFEKGESYQRRVIWCPMFGTIEKKDPRFISKLTTPEALEYWVKLMVEGYYSLYENAAFTESQKVNDYNAAYHEENNGTLTFIRESKDHEVLGKRPPEVYETYQTWAEENGVNVQSKKILRETFETERGWIVGAKFVVGKTAKVYMKK
ncbi:phage/plasmid primase, P4 family [Paenibacillus sp. OV219]|uniref:DNA primase family protein n=1 Tax=Paenibacillus sp. OV219 TaxID=1884377 RepID=UPI0008C28BBF|nr:phage/plasmid primase, P4 family [Paenibacillus sp. OV219]SEN21022.1 putative DNA primase/helicase [Paenibacillus sp. OV219]